MSQNAPTHALNERSTHDNDLTFFDQRPIVEPSQFEPNDHLLLAKQSPSLGNYLGLRFPEYRNTFKQDCFQFGTKEFRAWCVSQIVSRESTRLEREGLPHSVVTASVDRIRTSLEDDREGVLLAKLVALIPEQILAPENEGLPKPTNEFVRRLSAGYIRPPCIDLSLLSSPEDGPILIEAIRFAFTVSGIPRLSHAFGISDVLAHEAGSLGDYGSRNKDFHQDGQDYSSRTSIPAVSRLAWNQTTKDALYSRYPFFPANMRCVSDIISARAAIAAGICPIVPFTKRNQEERLAASLEFGPHAFITVRSNQKEFELARSILKNGSNICLEMANAHMPLTCEVVRKLREEFPKAFIMVGNVGSAEGYWYAVECGASVVKLGRGPGAGCTTPEETGISPGQVSLLYECAMTQLYLLFFRGKDVPMCLDGGLSTPGHIVIGSMLGAETFMMGSKFATCKESPAARYRDSSGNVYVHYFGEASAFAASLDNNNNRAKPQGIAGFLPEDGTYEELLANLVGGVQGGVADLGVRSLAGLAGTNRRLFARLKTEGSQRETGTRLMSLKLERSAPGRFETA